MIKTDIRTDDRIIDINWLPKEEMTAIDIEDRTNELNKKIEKLNKKISTQKTKEKKLEDKIKELENQKWKYEVGDIVLYDNWRKVRITQLINIKAGSYKFLYRGQFLDNSYIANFTQEELCSYDHCKYEETLINKIWELKNKLNKGKE